MGSLPYLDTVQTTFEGLWRAIETLHGNVHRRPEFTSDSESLRLLEGVVHPGKRLQWEGIDLAAYWDVPDMTPSFARDERSPHAAILAAATIHVRWVRAMDGEIVPFVWLPGYQRPLIRGHWNLVPALTVGLDELDQEERRIQLGYGTEDFPNGGTHAVPVSLRLVW